MPLDWKTLVWLCCYLPVVVCLTLFGLHRFYIVWLFWKHYRRPPQPMGRMTELPVVTVQLPVFNEMHVVRRLVEAVAALDYPKDRLQIQILDDSTDETVAICREETGRLRAAGFDVEHIHREDRSGFKAGAMENGLRTARGDYILILDADFIPQPAVLQEMIHYFTDPGVALVQSRWGHLNRDYSLLTRVQAMFLDGHLVVEQVARSRSGRFFNFNGTAGIWRKQAIIDAGGWEHDTLTEDLDLSYRAQMKGWRFIFLCDLVTPAELPVDVNGFKTQQHRWTKGSIQTCRKMLGPVWRSRQPLAVKIEATVHLAINFMNLLLICQCVVAWPGMGSQFDLGGYRLWLLDLPLFFFSTVSVAAFYLSSQVAAYPRHWLRHMLYYPMLIAVLVGMAVNNGRAVLEAILKQESPFVRTPKYGITDRQAAPKARKGYKSMKSMALGLEILMALYFSTVFIYACLKNYWSSVPFLLLFAMGFWYVAWGSLPQVFPVARKDDEGGPVAA